MKNFAIVTDSCGDLGENLREKYGIDYAPMRFSYDDVDVPASLDWEYVPLKDFYDLMRKGKRIKTSQVNAEEFGKNSKNTSIRARTFCTSLARRLFPRRIIFR